ncbi:MAG TPA: hypothetical protein PLA68_01055 [Panacibacter sp.]|nr:hypothetical protein [Panacibacter sp.]
MIKSKIIQAFAGIFIWGITSAQAQDFLSLNDTAVVKAEETPSTAAPIMAKNGTISSQNILP